MQLKTLADFGARILRQLDPVYLVAGEEPLQRLEAAEMVRQAARAAGYTERQVFTVENSRYDWNQLFQQGASMSLFAEQRLLEIRLESGKLGREGSAALARFTEELSENDILLVSCVSWEKSLRTAAWVKALDKKGVVLPIWPVEARALPGWLRQRMERLGMKPEQDAINAIARSVEGNLLAADQEIRKLFLLHGKSALSAQEVEESIADHARFDIFKLLDTALMGNRERTLRILAHLRHENDGQAPLLGALSRQLAQLAELSEQNSPAAREQWYRENRIWQAKQQLMSRAVNRLDSQQWQHLLGRCQALDAVLKGRADGEFWHVTEQILMQITGLDLSFTEIRDALA